MTYESGATTADPPVCSSCDAKAIWNNAGVISCVDNANCKWVDDATGLTCIECENNFTLLTDNTCDTL